jgi:hypothetical protein
MRGQSSIPAPNFSVHGAIIAILWHYRKQRLTCSKTLLRETAKKQLAIRHPMMLTAIRLNILPVVKIRQRQRDLVPWFPLQQFLASEGWDWGLGFVLLEVDVAVGRHAGAGRERPTVTFSLGRAGSPLEGDRGLDWTRVVYWKTLWR